MGEMSARPGLLPGMFDGALRAVFDAVEEGLLLVAPGGQLLAANRRLWALLGMAEVGTLSEIRTHVASCLAEPAQYLQFLSHEEDGQYGADELELELLRPLYRVVRRRVNIVRDEGGQVLGYLVGYRDVTRDAELNRLKTEFVANVSHELRTPMAAIKGFLDVVLDDEQSMPLEQRREFLGIAREQTDRLSRLIDDLLDISRIESGRRPRRDSRFKVSELLRDVVVSVRAEADTAAIALRVAPFEPAWELTADRDQIAQVMLNLITNAIKFTPAGGWIEVAAHEANDGYRFEVSDSGCGIAERDLPHVFDKFFRCRTAGAGPAGTGLGLAIARELTESHGGRLQVESEVGVGSTFTVSLPSQPAEGTS